MLAGVRVLLVDDSADQAEMYVAGLSRHGVEVIAAVSVREALERFAEEIPDVVVSDLHLPEQDGYALVRAIRASPPEQGGTVPVIALTGEGRADAYEQAMEAGFSEFCTKPCPPDELAQVLARVVASRGSSRGAR